MDNQVTTAGSAPPRPAARSARTGAVPALAIGFVTRPEAVPGLAEALVPGAMVVLTDAYAGPGQAGSCGKTQLAACLTGHLWRSNQVSLLAWVDASSRASVLSGYVEAAAAVGINPAAAAEDVAARFTGWMARLPGPGWWCSMTCATRRTSTVCGPAARRTGSWSPHLTPALSLASPGRR
jgi:hypothetical protein